MVLCMHPALRRSFLQPRLSVATPGKAVVACWSALTSACSTAPNLGAQPAPLTCPSHTPHRQLYKICAWETSLCPCRSRRYAPRPHIPCHASDRCRPTSCLSSVAFLSDVTRALVAIWSLVPAMKQNPSRLDMVFQDRTYASERSVSLNDR